MNTICLSAPSLLRAELRLPASKSISNRALVIAALGGDLEAVSGYSPCDDTMLLRRALAAPGKVVDIRAAGTSMRFLTAYLSATAGVSCLLTGTERMKARPIGPLVDALRQVGALVSYEGEKGFPPLSIEGRALQGGSVVMDGSVSSQFVSALLLIAPTWPKGLDLQLTGGIVSRPYIDLTLCVMHEFGAEADWTSATTIAVKPTGYRMKPFAVESDWSAASYWYEMVALAPKGDHEVRLRGLADGSRQGDSVARYLFSLLGVRTTFKGDEGVILRPSGRLVPRLEYDFSGAPDLAQTFVVTCALLGVPFSFTGLQTLRWKETDRIAALEKEMFKLGYVLRHESAGRLSWDGTRCEPQPEPVISTYDDHRMALAFAPAALRGSIAIENPEVVSKSYPAFWEDLREAHFELRVKS